MSSGIYPVGVVPKFSDLEVIALSITAEAFHIDSENYLFYRLNHECKDDLPNLISRRQFNARRKLTARLAEDIRKCGNGNRRYGRCILHRLQTHQGLSERKGKTLRHGA